MQNYLEILAGVQWCTGTTSAWFWSVALTNSPLSPVVTIVTITTVVSPIITSLTVVATSLFSSSSKQQNAETGREMCPS